MLSAPTDNTLRNLQMILSNNKIDISIAVMRSFHFQVLLVKN